MICLSSFMRLFLRYIWILLAYLFIYFDDHQYIRIYKWICLVFALILVIFGSLTYAFVRTKQGQTDNGASEQSSIEEKVVCRIPDDHPKELNTESCSLPIKPCLSNDVIFKRSLRRLICYCDGSYSSRSRIGFSAFRASNGYDKCCRCPVPYPYCDSTECEVFAAYLALHYTGKYQYDILILYTDNLKVEQLLNRPKEQDFYDYRKLFQARQRCFQGSEYFHMQVVRVRGHTT